MARGLVICISYAVNRCGGKLTVFDYSAIDATIHQLLTAGGAQKADLRSTAA
jgi:hypothetical protein